jgi:hypothetical protein
MNEVKVTHIDLAAFLQVKGFLVDRVEVNGKTVTLVFSDPENTAKRVISQFYKNDLVPVKDFINATRGIKDQMFETKRQISNKGNMENEQAYSILAVS